MILMMALMLLTVVRLLVARVRATFLPRVLARLVEFAVSLIRAKELRLVSAAIVSAIVSAITLVVAATIPRTGLLTAVS
jgi:hypothetical protein